MFDCIVFYCKKHIQRQNSHCINFPSVAANNEILYQALLLSLPSLSSINSVSSALAGYSRCPQIFHLNLQSYLKFVAKTLNRLYREFTTRLVENKFSVAGGKLQVRRDSCWQATLRDFIFLTAREECHTLVLHSEISYLPQILILLPGTCHVSLSSLSFAVQVSRLVRHASFRGNFAGQGPFGPKTKDI